MNRSTPISQLPSSQNTQEPFINDQQRQIVSQAQQAAQDFPLPQNTQLNHEISNDNDATVQEVLNQLNAATNSSQPSSSIAQLHQTPPNIMTQTIQPNMMQSTAQQMPMSMHQMPSSAPQTYLSPSSARSMDAQWFNNPLQEPLHMSLTQHLKDSDLTLLIIVLLGYVLVSILPVENFVFNYVALYRIPYASLAIKAIMCALLVFVLKKLFA
jgi:hypothetical protein